MNIGHLQVDLELRLEVNIFLEGFREGQHVLIVPIDRLGVLGFSIELGSPTNVPNFLGLSRIFVGNPQSFEAPNKNLSCVFAASTKITVLEVQDPKGQYDAFSTISRVGCLATG